MIGEVQVAQGNMVGIQGQASGRLARQRVSRSQVQVRVGKLAGDATLSSEHCVDGNEVGDESNAP